MQFFAVLRRRTEAFSDAEFAERLEAEAECVRSLYARGVVRGAWSREDVPGAVLLLEAPSAQAAREALESLPLLRGGMLELQFLPVRGYRGFGPRG